MAASELGCDSLILNVLTFKQHQNAFYASLFMIPVALGVAMLSYSNRLYAGQTSFPHFLVALLAFMASVPVMSFLGILGFWSNQYFVDTRCPSNAEEIDFDCSFILSRYYLVQVENSVNTGLSLAMMVSALFYLKKAYEMIEEYETARA